MGKRRRDKRPPSSGAQPPLPPRVMDFGTPELAQRCELVKEYIDKHTTRARNLCSTWPLERYNKRGTINDFQYRAGHRLYRDFNKGRIQGYTGSNWPDPSRLPHNKGGWRELDMTEAQAEAASSFRDAYRSLNYEGAIIAWYVICIGVDVGIYEQSCGWRKGYGMTRLREALDDLARHYRHP